MRRYPTLALLALVTAAALSLAVAGATGGPGRDDGVPVAAASPGGAPPAPAYGADELALQAIRQEGIEQTRRIAALLAAETDPARRRELRQQAVRIKQETRLRFLETLADQALRRGDPGTARIARAEIERLLNPPRPQVVPAAQRPDKGLGAKDLDAGGRR